MSQGESFITPVGREHLSVALGSGPYRPDQILVPRRTDSKHSRAGPGGGGGAMYVSHCL